MNKKEREYKDIYKTCREVSPEDCYMGIAKNCGTCAHCAEHDSSFWYFENSYCTVAKR